MLDPKTVMCAKNNMRKRFFEELKRYVEEKYGGRHAAAAAKLGIPPWQMTRWFSANSKSYRGWTKPRTHILKKLVLADVHPISTIARALLSNEGVSLYNRKPPIFKPIKGAEALYYRNLHRCVELALEAAALVEQPPTQCSRGPTRPARTTAHHIITADITPVRRSK
jgi:hypothetical protein